MVGHVELQARSRPHLLNRWLHHDSTCTVNSLPLLVQVRAHASDRHVEEVEEETCEMRPTLTIHSIVDQGETVEDQVEVMQPSPPVQNKVRMHVALAA